MQLGFQSMTAPLLHQKLALVKANSIPTELTVNLDEEAIKLVPFGEWPLDSGEQKSSPFCSPLVIVHSRNTLQPHLLASSEEHFSPYRYICSQNWLLQCQIHVCTTASTSITHLTTRKPRTLSHSDA